MDDIEFLYISKLIFKNRSKNEIVHPEFDNISNINFTNDEIISKYFSGNELKLNLNSGDSGVLIDMLNYYIPNFDLKIIINNEQEHLLSKRFNPVSHFSVKYELMGETVFHFSNLHGGETFITGDVDSVSLLNVIESSSVEIVMRTNITIYGSLRGNVDLFFDKLYSIVYKIIQNNADDLIFSINIDVSGKIKPDHKYKKEDLKVKNNFIRCWEIKHESYDDKHRFSVMKIHSLR